MQLKIPKQKHRVEKCMGFLGGSVGKESACNAGDLGSIPRLGRSPGEFRGLYSPCGRKESGMTEQVSLSVIH